MSDSRFFRSYLDILAEQPNMDPVAAAQENLQKAQENVRNVQAQLAALTQQKTDADAQLAAARQAVTQAQRQKQQTATQTQPAQPTQPTTGTFTQGVSVESMENETSPKEFIKDLRRSGWSIYISTINEKQYLLEFEKDSLDFNIVGRNNRWELYRTGPTLSGRGEKFTSLEDAFASATSNKKS